MLGVQVDYLSLRQRVIKDLTSRVGFAFSETDLSPPVRKKIGEIETDYQGLDSKSADYSVLTNTASKPRSTAIVLSIIGVFFLLLGILAWPFAIIGIVLFGAAAFFIVIAWTKGTEMAKSKEAELSTLVSTLRTKLDTVGKTIYEELSARYAARAGPKISQMIKETTIVKEVVMIPCAYCKGLMPQTSVFCPICGARRTG
jgi:hypothetical protein